MKRLMLMLALVLLPTQVLAGSAWVLWCVPAEGDSNVPIKDLKLSYSPNEWQPIAGYETAEACEPDREKRHVDFMSATLPRPGVVRVEICRCLPDTVDPRPKEGR